MVKNAFLIVVAAAMSAVIMYWQFFTSDIHPYTETISIRDTHVKLKLTRKAGTGNVVVTLPGNLYKYNPVLYYKIDTVKKDWETRYFMKEDSLCMVYLPMHHKGVRVEYKIHYIEGLEEKIVPNDKHVKLRFKGEVPSSILILHILFMELVLIFSVWLGLNSIVRKTSDERVLWLNNIAIFVGGILLG
ncbi:MAG: hypothetical protein MI922_18830, partial [Bacteroidales bacterium]|nr:hypothetical protein [Bacteroidales bacterium]